MKKTLPPPPPPMPSLPCQVDAPAPITVGEKLLIKCALGEKASAASAGVEFKNGDSDVPYSLVFLDKPQVTGAVLTQSFTSYKVGHYEFAKITVKIGGETFQVPAFKFEVKTVVQGEPSPTPFPIAGPQNLSAPWWWWALWASVIAVALFLMVKRFMKWKKNRVEEESAPAQKILTPQEKFTQDLQKLESQNWHFKGEYKKFALELTVILKKAIGEKFKFPAEDLTTEEFIETLRRRQGGFFKSAGTPLTGVFETLDQIKFAKTEVSSDKCVGLIDITKNIGGILYGGDK